MPSHRRLLQEEASSLLAKTSPSSSEDDESALLTPLKPNASQGSQESITSAVNPPRVTPDEVVLNFFDDIEDEIDQAYEDLVPVHIKVALEDKIFGWTHLFSDILGHLAFTSGAFFSTMFLLRYIFGSHRYYYPQMFTCALSAIWAFRVVRRRRQVYLRAPYGSKAYFKDRERRQREVLEADRSSWLGRLRSHRKRKKMHKQLVKAETTFSEHIQRGPSFSPTKAQADSSENDDTDVSVGSSTSSPLKRARRPSFQTDSVMDMQSVQHDQIIFRSGKINRLPYAHGGHFAAAPFMLNNPHWISILRRLMPDVYVEISRRILAPPQRLIHWAENNPVVAAYGSAHELEYNRSVSNIEWDVFLPPALVYRVMVVLEERNSYLETQMPEVAPIKPYQTVKSSDADVRNVFKYFEQELSSRVTDLVNAMLIAHGKLNNLVLENFGPSFLKNYNFGRVRRSRRTLGGGIFAQQWMAVYAEALRLGKVDESRLPKPHDARAIGASTLDRLTDFLCPDMTIAESVQMIESLLGRKEPLGLVLDVKSRNVPPVVLACVVDKLRADGIRVEGIGSFAFDDIRDISLHTLSPVSELIYFHSAGELQHACHAGRIRRGDCVFFNAGSLLWQPMSYIEHLVMQCTHSFAPEALKQEHRILGHMQVASDTSSYQRRPDSSHYSLKDYKKRYNLSIGVYVQEFIIDEKALDVLVKFVNDHSDVFDLGFAWGGVNGVTIRGISPGRFTSTDGFWNQRYLGALWRSDLPPPS